MVPSVGLVRSKLSESDSCDYLTCEGNCKRCTAKHRRQCLNEACDVLTDSVRDRKENGGTTHTVTARAFDLLRVMVADLETQ